MTHHTNALLFLARGGAFPAEREGLDAWVEDWCEAHSRSPRVAKVIVDAMARYRRSLEGVARFLRECGELPKDDG